MKVPDIPLFTPMGRYRMVLRLGQGARGVVYQADDLQTGRQVAVKFMGLPEDSDVRDARLRFEREAQMLSQLSHPHIVGFEGAGTLEHQGQRLPYMAMQFLPSLRTLDVAARENRDPAWLLDRLEELFQALDYMHHHPDPVIHRDLKPANLGIPLDRRLRVLDLGLARLSSSVLTHQGTFMGSLGYIAPEQIMDAKRVDSRADLYSVGMIMLELLGGHPFREMNSGKAIRCIVGGKIPPTPEPIAEPLDRFARRLCACAPEDRPPSAGQALAEFRAMRQKLAAPRRSVPPAPTSVGGWDSVVGFLGQQLKLTQDGQGGAVLVYGRNETDRTALLDTMCQRAMSMGIKVWRAQDSSTLAHALGCATDEQSLFDTLSNDAEEQPTLVAVGDLASEDAVLERVLHLAVRSGEPLMVLASAVNMPLRTGRVTLFHIR